MRMQKKIVFCLLGVFILTSSIAFAQEQDIEGSKDHPLVSRFAGSVIKYYDLKQFDEYVLPLGNAVKKRDKEGRVVLDERHQFILNLTESKGLEGKVTRIFYEAPEGRSTLEIFRSYEAALKRAGFEILFSGAGEELGSGFDRFIYPGGRLGQIVLRTLPRTQRYLAANLSRPAGEVYVSLYTSLHRISGFRVDRREDHPAIKLVVVEVKPMEVGLVTAGTMLDDIDKTGHVAIYGIYFEFGKADVKPESGPALEEIATLLQQNPKLKLHVVGHTDNVGDLTYNMKLSQSRADAVVKELVSKHGVDAKRLKAHGVGPLSPVISNKTEEGRAKNRRVELVGDK